MRRRLDLTRRSFLTATGAAVSAPYFVPASALGRDGTPAPSERTTVGHIGVGGRGAWLMQELSGMRQVQSVAVAEADAGRRADAAAQIERRYAQRDPAGRFNGVGQHADFRELLARDDVDAVVIATPDHWHGVMTCMALRAGKDCYTEKPLALTVPEGRAIVDTARAHGRIVQTGSHERSRANARYACELVRNGRLGKLHTIRVNMPVDNHGPIDPQPVMPVPEGLDWDMWLGPAPWAPYTERRAHFWFRYILDYSGGEMTDRGAHILDLAQLGAGRDHTGPVKVEGEGWRPTDGLFDTFMEYKFRLEYADGVRVLGESVPPRGIRFEGDEGWVFLHIHGGNLEASDATILRERFGPEEVHLGRSPGHGQDFVNAVRTRREPMAPAEVGHRSAAVCNITNIAMLLGRPLEWDPAAERFVGDDAANRMLHRPMRDPWSV